MFVDPPRVRGLARATRAVAEATRQRAPLSGGANPVAGADDNELAVSLRDAAAALDRVVDYHAGQYVGFAHLCTRGADSYENADDASGQRLRSDLAHGRTSAEPDRRGGGG